MAQRNWSARTYVDGEATKFSLDMDGVGGLNFTVFLTRGDCEFAPRWKLSGPFWEEAQFLCSGGNSYHVALDLAEQQIHKKLMDLASLFK